MKKRHIIKITESQLKEADNDAFHYLDATDDTSPFNGQSSISAQGKMNGWKNGEPIMTDRIANQRIPQGWWRYRGYGNLYRPQPGMKDLYNEGVAINTDLQGDENQDGIDDVFTNIASVGQGNGVKSLSDGDDNNNLAVIPQGVENKLNILVDAINQSKLNPKQIATVLDKFQESFPQLSQNSAFIKSLLRQQIDVNDIRDFN